MSAFLEDDEDDRELVPITRPAEFPDFQFYEDREEACGEICEAEGCITSATHRARSLLGAIGFWLCDQHAEWLRRELGMSTPRISGPEDKQ